VGQKCLIAEILNSPVDLYYFWQKVKISKSGDFYLTEVTQIYFQRLKMSTIKTMISLLWAMV